MPHNNKYCWYADSREKYFAGVVYAWYRVILFRKLRHATHTHDDVIKWKHVPRNWPFGRGIPRTKPLTRSFDVFVDLRLNKRLGKQSWGWWFEMPWRALWRHCNGLNVIRATSDMCLVHSKLQKLIKPIFEYWRMAARASVDTYQVNNSTQNALNPKINNLIHKDWRRV